MAFLASELRWQGLYEVVNKNLRQNTSETSVNTTTTALAGEPALQEGASRKITARSAGVREDAGL